MACAQTSVSFRDAIKRSFLQKRCVYLHKFSVPSAVAALAVSLSQRQNGKKAVMRVRKKELGNEDRQ